MVCLSDRNADETIALIETKLSKGEKINLLELIYLPLYSSNTGKTTCDLLDYAIKLTPKVSEDKHIQSKLGSLLILLMARFISEEEFKKILEENAMVLEDNVAVKVLTQRGEEKAKLETALEMLRDGMGNEPIAKYVKMPVDWVRKLRENNEN